MRAVIRGDSVSDLVVVGLDLRTGLEVSVQDRSTASWRTRGYNGDQTLVCLDCYTSSSRRRVVALVPKGRVGGKRRAHFAHPPRYRLEGGHHGPETSWHALGKQLIRDWALAAGAASAQVEAFTPDGLRRSDVSITLPSGVHIAVEVQQRLLRDEQWQQRHRDYVANGIRDIWLWNPAPECGVSRLLYARDQPGWLFDVEHERLGLVLGEPHDRRDRWWEHGHLEHYARHWPPCLHDKTTVIWMNLADVRLTDDGIQPTPAAEAKIRDAVTAVRQEAEQCRSTPPADPSPTTARPILLVAPRRNSVTDHTVSAERRRQARPHLIQRIDAYPPWTDFDKRKYWCPVCNYLTGAELRDNPYEHEIATTDRWITAEDLDPETYWL